MGHKNREIEVKMLVADPGAKWVGVVSQVEAMLKGRVVDTVRDQSGDDYWSPSSLSKKAVVRLTAVGDQAEVTLSLPGTSVKMTVDSLKQAEALFSTLLPTSKPKAKSSGEYKWSKEAPETMADFVRIRQEDKTGKACVTVKGSDHGGNFNRIEIDMTVNSQADAADFFTAMFGPKKGAVVKRYNVYFLDHKETNVALYQIVGSPHVFIEVEAHTEKKVVDLCESLVNDLGLPLSRVKNSLYDIFVRGRSPKLRRLKGVEVRRVLAEAS